MANYIQTLKEENIDLKNRILSASETIQFFREYLELNKFKGYEDNGNRKNWISTPEIHDLLSKLNSDLN